MIMATIRFIIKGKSNPISVLLRLRHGRKVDVTKETGYLINIEDWKNGQPNVKTANGKKLNEDLKILDVEILKRFNEATTKGETINNNWLSHQMDSILNRDEETDLNNLIKYIEHYIAELPTHIQKRTKKVGVSVHTIKKFKTLKNKVVEYEKSKKSVFLVSDISPKFTQEFTTYLLKQNYSINYVGSLVKYLKTVCTNARGNEIKTHKRLSDIDIIKETSQKIVLSFGELEKINNFRFERTSLSNARDWLVIGCYLGQRVSDLLNLTNENLIVRSGIQMIEFTQQKTGKLILTPLHPIIESNLERNGGLFPHKISDVNFNKYIKEVCQLVGIKTPTKGAKLDNKTKRKEQGIYPKWELITSHICRRSFATNYYGTIPTPILMGATGHTEEKTFLIYIGKNEEDKAMQLAEYWTKEALQAKQEPQMTVIKKAN
jgi:integrase